MDLSILLVKWLVFLIRIYLYFIRHWILHLLYLRYWQTASWLLLTSTFFVPFYLSYFPFSSSQNNVHFLFKHHLCFIFPNLRFMPFQFLEYHTIWATLTLTYKHKSREANLESKSHFIYFLETHTKYKYPLYFGTEGVFNIWIICELY